jgi:hypothetical protein
MWLRINDSCVQGKVSQRRTMIKVLLVLKLILVKIKRSQMFEWRQDVDVMHIYICQIGPG